MHERVRWKQFLKDKKQRNRLSETAKRKQLFEIREKAKQCMEDLTLIMNSIKDASRQPERDFALIFKEENTYFKMFESMNRGYEESFKSGYKLFAPENLGPLQGACARTGITIHSKKWLSDRHNHQKIKEQLVRKIMADGRTGLRVFRDLCESAEHSEEQHRELAEKSRALQWSVRCSKCGLEQKPMDWMPVVKCSCGYEGPVIGNPYDSELWKGKKTSAESNDR